MKNTKESSENSCEYEREYTPSKRMCKFCDVIDHDDFTRYTKKERMFYFNNGHKIEIRITGADKLESGATELLSKNNKKKRQER
jgi:hypothetical protein